jgi:single-strand DNA-binding protein
MNKIMIAGNLGTDPEVRHSAKGTKVTSFSLASNKRKGQETTTTWFKITTFGDHLDKIISYLKKGSAVIVMGEVEARIYTDKNGNAQVSLDVIASSIDFSPFSSGSQNTQQQQQGANNNGFNTNNFNSTPNYSQNQPAAQPQASFYGSNPQNGFNQSAAPQNAFAAATTQGNNDDVDSFGSDIMPF